MKNKNLPTNIPLHQDGRDFFLIYQLCDTTVAERLHFRDYEYFISNHMEITCDLYELIYTGKLSADTTLEEIYETFNINHPEDFHGHSLSVSDVVVLHRKDEVEAFFVDSIGFKKIPDFLISNDETEETQKELEWNDDSCRGCTDCPEDECTGHCMSCYYRPV